MLIQNRTFVVSGGASGLGLETARALHAKGAYLAILDLNEEAGTKFVSELCEIAVQAATKPKVSTSDSSSIISVGFP